MAQALDIDLVCESAASILRSCGVNARAWDSGGDTLGIAITEADGDPSEPKFFFGTAGDRWGASVEGHPAGLWTDVPSDEDDPTRIASGVLAALATFSKDQA